MSTGPHRRTRLLTAAAPAAVLLLALAACGTAPTSAAPPHRPATTTSSKPPVPSTPTTAALPGAPPCDPSAPGGSGPRVQPTVIYLGCATGADQLQGIDWSSWTATGASGTGTHAVNDCSPNCTSGSFTYVPVNITLTDPGMSNGMSVFQTISFVPSGVDDPTETDSVGWGWVPG